MNMNINGCSTCKPGEEQYEFYYSDIVRKNLVQYDYRTPDGQLFSCVGISLEACRKKRDKWVKFNNIYLKDISKLK